MRVADECRVLSERRPSSRRLSWFPKYGLGVMRLKCAKSGVQQSRRRDSPLLVALLIPEEENAVAPDRAAEGKAKLPPLEKGIGIGGIAVERGIGGQLVVAEKVKGRAVQIVAARARDHVDGGAVGETRRKVEVHGRDLELLNDFL